GGVQAEVSPAGSALAAGTVGGPRSRRALILAPAQPTLQDSLGAIQGPLAAMGYDVTVVTGPAATADWFRGDTLARFGVVYIRTTASAAESLGLPSGAV